MAGVFKLFDEMTYGDVQANSKLVMEWLVGKDFGPFIGGTWETPRERDEERITIELFSISIKVSSTSREQVEKAVNSCLDAQEAWQRNVIAREGILMKVAHLLEKNAALLAQVEALNRGVLIKDPIEFDVPALISWFKYYAGWSSLGKDDWTDKRTPGIVSVIASENTPLISLGWLLAPTLATGKCVCFCIPSKNSLTAMLLAEIFKEAGIPSGVFNVLPASQETVESLVLHPEVSKIRAFGSTTYVKQIREKVSTVATKLFSAVMTDRSPMILFSSCDIDSAVESAVRSAWHNQGSVPWSVKRMLVQESIFETFLYKIKLRLKNLRLGNCFDSLADLGQPYDDKVVENIANLTALAQANGLEIFQRELSEVESANGFFPPTLLIGGEYVSNHVFDSQDYAPVISVKPFRTAKEAVEMANNSRYGLAASVWTNKFSIAVDVSNHLQFGTVWINCHGVVDPSVEFQGWKESGCGNFGGKAGFFDCSHQQPKLRSSTKSNEKGSPAVPLDSGGIFKTVNYKLYHSGGYKDADENATRSLVVSNDTLFTFAEAKRKDVIKAAEAAGSAFAGWSSNLNAREELLRKVHLKIKDNKEKLISTLSLSQKVEDMETEFSQEMNYASGSFKFWTYACNKSYQMRGQKAGFMVNTTREPLGVVVLGIYCNVGVETRLCHTAIWQLAAALTYGNPVVVVVDMVNPSGLLELLKTICEAGFPPGVLSVLTGNTAKIMKSLVEHQSVTAIYHWCYPLEMVLEIELVACKNMKPVRACIIEDSLQTRADITELTVTRSKAVWFPKGEIFGK